MFGSESENVGNLRNPYLIQNLGRDSSQNDTEEFICQLYRALNIEAGVNKCNILIVVALKNAIGVLVNAIKLASVALL